MGSEEEYILKWNDHKNNFFSLMAEDLFQQELLTDLTVCCGDTLFSAHRLVLSVCSPYFRHMLTSAPANRFPIIFLNDIHPTDFERLLQFMYYGEVRIPNSDLEPLIRTATSLKIKGLSAHPTSGTEGPEMTSSNYGNVTTNVTTTKDPLQTPIKKRRISSDEKRHTLSEEKRHILSDADERCRSPSGSIPDSRLNPPPPLAFGYESQLQMRIPSRSPLPLQQQQQQQHPRIPYRSDSCRTSPLRVRTPPTRILQENRITKLDSLGRHHTHGHSPPSDVSQSSTSSSLAPATHMKEEASDDGAVSPPPQTETVPLLIGAGSDPLQQQRKALVATSNMSHSQPRTETRKTGTCYFCKKAFMKNKQLMNHVCPKKPKGSNSSATLNVVRVRSPGFVASPMSSALALITRK